MHQFVQILLRREDWRMTVDNTVFFRNSGKALRIMRVFSQVPSSPISALPPSPPTYWPFPRRVVSQLRIRSEQGANTLSGQRESICWGTTMYGHLSKVCDFRNASQIITLRQNCRNQSFFREKFYMILVFANKWLISAQGWMWYLIREHCPHTVLISDFTLCLWDVPPGVSFPDPWPKRHHTFVLRAQTFMSQ